MISSSRQLVRVVILLLLCLCGVKAQGLYYNFYIDDVYVSTETDGYPGSGCGGGPTSVWSSLQGNYSSGYAPVTIDQQTYTLDGQNYSWTIGFSMLVPNPYGGCHTYNYSEVLFQGPLRKIRAYYQNVGSLLGLSNYHRCNPNNAFDTLLSRQRDAFVLLTVYQINIAGSYSCQAWPNDKVVVSQCLSPDPIP